MKQNIKGMLSLEELEELVKREEIDTVLMVFTAVSYTHLTLPTIYSV